MTVRELTWLQESMPRLPQSSRSSSVIADGATRKCLLRWRNSVSRGPMPCKGTVRTAAKPTMISSPHGKTRPRIPRHSVKPKLNTKNSLPPHRSPLQHQGKSNRRGFHKRRFFAAVSRRVWRFRETWGSESTGLLIFSTRSGANSLAATRLIGRCCGCIRSPYHASLQKTKDAASSPKQGP